MKYLLIAITVIIAASTNSVSAIWAKNFVQGSDKTFLWLMIMLIMSPLVFISFGLVSEKVGLSIAAGTVDAALTISTILIGLFIFGEWNKLSVPQYIGLVMIIVALVLLVAFPKKI